MGTKNWYNRLNVLQPSYSSKLELFTCRTILFVVCLAAAASIGPCLDNLTGRQIRDTGDLDGSIFRDGLGARGCEKCQSISCRCDGVR